MEIIRNALSPSIFALCKEKIFHYKTAWYFSNTAYNHIKQDDMYDYSFSHMVFDNGEILSSLHDVLFTSIIGMMDFHNRPINVLHRIRLGLLTVTDKQHINDAHIDQRYQHKTGLIYLNNSDAPTYLYRNRYDPASNMPSYEYLKTIQNQLEVECVSECIENSLLLFDGYQYHASSTPTNVPRRIAINFNYE